LPKPEKKLKASDRLKAPWRCMSALGGAAVLSACLALPNARWFFLCVAPPPQHRGSHQVLSVKRQWRMFAFPKPVLPT
jgi:hypothetical protein